MSANRRDFIKFVVAGAVSAGGEAAGAAATAGCAEVIATAALVTFR